MSVSAINVHTSVIERETPTCKSIGNYLEMELPKEIQGHSWWRSRAGKAVSCNNWHSLPPTQRGPLPEDRDSV